MSSLLPANVDGEGGGEDVATRAFRLLLGGWSDRSGVTVGGAGIGEAIEDDEDATDSYDPCGQNPGDSMIPRGLRADRGLLRELLVALVEASLL